MYGGIILIFIEESNNNNIIIIMKWNNKKCDNWIIILLVYLAYPIPLWIVLLPSINRRQGSAVSPPPPPPHEVGFLKTPFQHPTPIPAAVISPNPHSFFYMHRRSGSRNTLPFSPPPSPCFTLSTIIPMHVSFHSHSHFLSPNGTIRKDRGTKYQIA